MFGFAVDPSITENSILLSAAMEPPSGSAGRPADEPLDSSAEQRDQYHDCLLQRGSSASSVVLSLMMLDAGKCDAASGMVLGAYVAQGPELEQGKLDVQRSANAARACTAAPPSPVTCISSASKVITTTTTQYRPLGYSHEEVTLVPWETSPPTPPLDQFRPMGYCHEEVTLVHSPDRNIGLRHSADSSAAQPVHRFSDADGETITGDGSYMGDQHKKEAVEPKPPPPAIYCVVCKQACGYPHAVVHWSTEEDWTMRVPTCGAICLMTHNSNVFWCADRGGDDQQNTRWTPTLIEEQLLLFNKGTHFTLAEVDSNSDASEVGCAGRAVDHSAKSSAERPAQHSETGVPPRDLDDLLRERYHAPGLPKSFGGSRHLVGRTSATVPRQNNSGSAEQPAPLREAVSPVPVSSPDLNTGLRNSNPQSGDLVPCHGAKPPPPALRVVANKAPPPNSSLPLFMAGFRNATSFTEGHRAPPEALNRWRNRQEPIHPSKASPPAEPRRFLLFRQSIE